jgi:hypothetical protein
MGKEEEGVKKMHLIDCELVLQCSALRVEGTAQGHSS